MSVDASSHYSMAFSSRSVHWAIDNNISSFLHAYKYAHDDKQFGNLAVYSYMIDKNRNVAYFCANTNIWFHIWVNIFFSLGQSYWTEIKYEDRAGVYIKHTHMYIRMCV